MEYLERCLYDDENDVITFLNDVDVIYYDNFDALEDGDDDDEWFD